MKKLIFSFIASIIAVACTLGLVACGNHTHTWSDKWSGNDANHWHDCTDPSCRQRSDISSHSWFLTTTLEKSTCTDEGSGIYTCFICGRTKTDAIEKSGHNWKLIYTEYAPNCITEGRGSYRCLDCGITQDKMVIPATGEHKYSKAWEYDEMGHYHVCMVEGCGAKTESINHVEFGPITIPEGLYTDGADEMRCADCNYLFSSVRRPASGIPVSFDVQFGSVLAAGGEVALVNSKTYALTYPNAVNEAGNLIMSLPFYNNGTGMKVYMVTDNGLGYTQELTFETETLGFTYYQGVLYTKKVGNFTLKFKFLVNDVVKAETTIKVAVR